MITAFRLGFRPDPFRAADQLRRTAKAIEFGNDTKLKHVLRLRHCEKRIRQQGWYDPSEWGRIK